jgi:hypothetical protein
MQHGLARRNDMSVIDFFDYLAIHDQTAELAHQLADAWAEHALADVYEPAA